MFVPSQLQSPLGKLKGNLSAMRLFHHVADIPVLLLGPDLAHRKRYTEHHVFASILLQISFKKHKGAPQKKGFLPRVQP